jgi:hypothetical protein
MRAVWREGIVPLLQMHDCLDCSVATREQAEMVAQLCVEAVQLKVPMRVDLKFGRTWGDAKHTWEELQSTTEPAAFVSASTPVANLTITSNVNASPRVEPTPASTAVQSNGAHAGDGARCRIISLKSLLSP